MIKLGDYNTLSLVRFTDYGAILDGGEVGDILMPRKYVAPGLREGDNVEVFIYLDQSERLVATTEQPLARVGDFAYLRVAWVNQYGAFLDWGLMKDLFVPFREQKREMEPDQSYIVHIHIDEETRRIVGSAKVERYLQPASPQTHHRGQTADILVWQKTPLGFKLIVDNAYAGMIYDNQIFGHHVPHTGDRLTGTIVNVRPDGRLDISLQSIGKSRFRDFSETLLDELQKAGGTLPFSDHSDAETIAERFGVSKKTFKRALGNLYKNGSINIFETKIELIKQ